MLVSSGLISSNPLILNLEKEDEEIKDTTMLVVLFLLIVSWLTITVSILGGFFICCKNRFYVCIYGVIILPTWVIIMAIGLVTFTALNEAPKRV